MLLIRRLELGEGELYRAVRLQSLEDSPAAFVTTLEDALARSHRSWAAQADSSAAGNDRATFVALDGKPVGLGAIYRDTSRLEDGELLQVWVAPDCRGGGVAIRLLDALFAWAASVGFQTIRAEVFRDNPRALRFYEKYGFSREGLPADRGSSNWILAKPSGQKPA